MFDTKFCENRSRPLILDKFDFFFIVTSNLKNSMNPRSFLFEEAKIRQRTSSKRELREIGEVRKSVIWESRFTCFFIFFDIHIGILKIV